MLPFLTEDRYLRHASEGLPPQWHDLLWKDGKVNLRLPDEDWRLTGGGYLIRLALLAKVDVRAAEMAGWYLCRYGGPHQLVIDTVKRFCQAEGARLDPIPRQIHPILGLAGILRHARYSELLRETRKTEHRGSSPCVLISITGSARW